MILLDGVSTSENLLKIVKSSLADNMKQIGRPPRLDIILVGEDFSSKKYVQMKEKKAKDIGFTGVVHHLSEDTTTTELLQKVEELNLYPDVDGFMVQLPLPKHIDTELVLSNIDIPKDVDGLNPMSLGLLFNRSSNAMVPATPKGIMLLLEEYYIELDGMNVVIIGRSNIVGLPLAAMMINANATVTIAHTHTKDIESIANQADILVSATGMPKLVTKEFVKKDAVVVDVGINRDKDSNLLVGDVDFVNVAPLTSYITPVPGGVGPMTIASLMDNTLTAWLKKR